MKKALALLTALTLMLGCCVGLTSCFDASAPEGTVTRMQLDINPSIEFMVDDENKVISVTALNDDGSVLIAGEIFVGLSAEDAVSLAVSLAAQTGYLVKGEVSADENEVKISVSGDTAYAKKLKEKIQTEVKSALDEAGITGKVTEAAAMAKAELTALAAALAGISEEEAAQMTEMELYSAIAEGRIETALLLTEELREAYTAAKEYKISFAEMEQTVKIIQEMNSIYANALLPTYQYALTAFETALASFEQVRYDMLVSPDSAYQTALETLRLKKAEVLESRKLVASVTVDDVNYVTFEAELALSEEEYDNALAALEALGDTANTAWETALALLKTAQTSWKTMESTFPADIADALTEKTADVENAVNQAKDGFFREFEQAHAADIAAAKQALIDRKNALIAANAD